MTAPSDNKSTLDRREAVKALSLIPFAFSFDLTAPQRERAAQAMTAPLTSPKFFNPNEWKTVRMLADYIIPADDRSGSATEAKVPEYIDLLMADKDASDSSKIAMRGGLGWLNFESLERFGNVALSM